MVEKVVVGVEYYDPGCDCCCGYEEEWYYLESADIKFSSLEDLLTHLLCLEGIEVEFKEE